MSAKRIAYFSMGSGIYPKFYTYSGGLEVLAGDMIKEVIDSQGRYPMVFFHILWKKGYALQHICDNGEIIDEDPKNNNWEEYVEDTGKKVYVKIFGNSVAVKIWKLKAGPVYYLDTDLPENGGFCNITYYLYGGAWDSPEKERIAQEIVLGVGGVRALNELGLEVDGYHYNDGHPAFVGIELISQKMNAYHEAMPYLSNEECFERAFKFVKNHTVFTTHTNVPAGNESHSIGLLMEVGANCGLTYEQMNRIGGDPFGMTVASLRLSSKANGVSRIQVVAAKDMWRDVKDAPDIIAITNGVHRPTWQNEEIAKAFANNDIDGIYNAHQQCKKNTIEYIFEATGKKLELDNIILTWGRRFTEYKRPLLLCSDADYIEHLIEKEGIQIVYTGKSHRHDGSGKQYISEVHKLSKKYPNNIIFLEGYDIALSQKLVSGSDVWVNTPRSYFEASGTSGMKSAMNGTLNCSTSDGWWREAAIHKVNGWIIGRTDYIGTSIQDEEDAKSLRQLLVDEVLPTYHNKPIWKNMMYASIATTQYQYSMSRMLEEYSVNMYNYIGD